MSGPWSNGDRRAALRLAAGALLVPLVSALPARAHEAGRFVPPASPMRYTRRLERLLPGGACFSVGRTFGIRFEAAEAGFRIDGSQLAVEVDAPAPLATFADMERARVEAGVFPLLLDHHGRIVRYDTAHLGVRLDEAVGALAAEFERRPFDPAEREELRQFVGAVHQSVDQLFTWLPIDLFAPAEERRSETRAVALPGGEAGTVTVTFAATRDPATGLMREASREAVTELAGEQRRSLEQWRLEPLV